MLEWKKDSNYIIHESGFTIILEEGSFHEPSSIQIKKSGECSAIAQAKLIREGIEFVRSKTHVDSHRVTPLGSNTPKITVKKTRKICVPGSTE